MRLLAITIILGACNQQVVRPGPKDDQFNPLWTRCPEGGYCDRNTEVCRPATSDWPQGYCAFVGDDGRAFARRKRGPSDAGTD